MMNLVWMVGGECAYVAFLIGNRDCGACEIGWIWYGCGMRLDLWGLQWWMDFFW